MIGAFQNRENLYLVMDLLQGGDLRYHIGLRRYFTEEQTSILSFIDQNFLLGFALRDFI